MHIAKWNQWCFECQLFSIWSGWECLCVSCFSNISIHWIPAGRFMLPFFTLPSRLREKRPWIQIWSYAINSSRAYSPWVKESRACWVAWTQAVDKIWPPQLRLSASQSYPVLYVACQLANHILSYMLPVSTPTPAHTTFVFMVFEWRILHAVICRQTLFLLKRNSYEAQHYVHLFTYKSTSTHGAGQCNYDHIASHRMMKPMKACNRRDRLCWPTNSCKQEDSRN